MSNCAHCGSKRRVQRAESWDVDLCEVCLRTHAGREPPDIETLVRIIAQSTNLILERLDPIADELARRRIPAPSRPPAGMAAELKGEVDDLRLRLVGMRAKLIRARRG